MKVYHIDIIISESTDGTLSSMQPLTDLHRSIKVSEKDLKFLSDSRLSLKENLESIIVSVLS